MSIKLEIVIVNTAKRISCEYFASLSIQFISNNIYFVDTTHFSHYIIIHSQNTRKVSQFFTHRTKSGKLFKQFFSMQSFYHTQRFHSDLYFIFAFAFTFAFSHKLNRKRKEYENARTNIKESYVSSNTLFGFIKKIIVFNIFNIWKSIGMNW